MEKRVELINGFYRGTEEDSRLTRSARGRLEYATTMEYIHKYVDHGSKILEVGAGTGRYSIALAKEGFDITAVELVQHNLDILVQNSNGLKNIHAYQGDALDLGRFADNSFDAVLLLGPLYHLYEKNDVNKAINEGLRVVKKGGILISAFLSVHAILYTNYLDNKIRSGLNENFDPDFRVRHFEDQLFTGYDIPEFEGLFDETEVDYITTVSTDSLLELLHNYTSIQLAEEEFKSFLKYHMATCEKRELLGAANHLIHICRKR